MAVRQPPGYLAGSFPAPTQRAYEMFEWLQDPALSALGPLSGVCAKGNQFDFPITQSGATVTVGMGEAIVAGTESSQQYGYKLINESPIAFTIPAAPASQTRIDRIVARVRDSAYSGTYADADIVLIQGTPASSNPQAPAVPADALTLATVSTTGSGTPVVTPAWRYTVSPGGIRPARGGIADDGVAPQYAGQYRDLGGVLQRGDGPGGSWAPIASVASFVQAAATLKADNGAVLGMGSGGQAIVRALVFGKLAFLRYIFTFGNSPSGGADRIYTQLPSGLTLHSAGSQRLIGSIRTQPNGNVNQTYDWPLIAYCDPSTPNIYMTTPASTTMTALDYFKQTTASGGAGSGVPQISGGYPITSGTLINLQGFVELA